MALAVVALCDLVLHYREAKVCLPPAPKGAAGLRGSVEEWADELCDWLESVHGAAASVANTDGSTSMAEVRVAAADKAAADVVATDIAIAAMADADMAVAYIAAADRAAASMVRAWQLQARQLHTLRLQPW